MLHLVVRACISIRFSPITIVNIAVSYIIYILKLQYEIEHSVNP